MSEKHRVLSKRRKHFVPVGVVIIGVLASVAAGLATHWIALLGVILAVVAEAVLYVMDADDSDTTQRVVQETCAVARDTKVSTDNDAREIKAMIAALESKIQNQPVSRGEAQEVLTVIQAKYEDWARSLYTSIPEKKIDFERGRLDELEKTAKAWRQWRALLQALLDEVKQLLNAVARTNSAAIRYEVGDIPVNRPQRNGVLSFNELGRIRFDEAGVSWIFVLWHESYLPRLEVYRDTMWAPFELLTYTRKTPARCHMLCSLARYDETEFIYIHTDVAAVRSKTQTLCNPTDQDIRAIARVLVEYQLTRLSAEDVNADFPESVAHREPMTTPQSHIHVDSVPVYPIKQSP